MGSPYSPTHAIMAQQRCRHSGKGGLVDWNNIETKAEINAEAVNWGTSHQSGMEYSARAWSPAPDAVPRVELDWHLVTEAWPSEPSVLSVFIAELGLMEPKNRMAQKAASKSSYRRLWECDRAQWCMYVLWQQLCVPKLVQKGPTRLFSEEVSRTHELHGLSCSCVVTCTCVPLQTSATAVNRNLQLWRSTKSCWQW